PHAHTTLSLHDALPIFDKVPVIPRLLKASSKRQNPTRMPYSCQDQFAMSGRLVTPVGGGITCRAIGRSSDQYSTFMTGQTTTRTDRKSTRLNSSHVKIS